jgi:zinc transport system permease protein
MSVVLEIFQFDFMVRAFTAGIIIGITAPLIGIFLVVRRYSMLADTLAHVSLAGVAVGVLTKSHPVISAIAVSVLSSFGIEKLRASKKVFGESLLAIFLWGGLASAVVMISIAGGFNVGLFSFLFGSITTVTREDLYIITTLGALIVVLVTVFYKELFFISFDEEVAEVSGISARGLNLLIVIMAALTISLSMRIVGVLLIGALMVIPVITAMQFNRSFKQTLLLSVIISLVSVIAGLFFSYFLGLASGGTIVLMALAFFIITLFFRETR